MIVFNGEYVFKKRNLESKIKFCGFCGKTHSVNSYDATFMEYLNAIPISKPKRFHVSDYCVYTKQYVKYTIEDWQKILDKIQNELPEIREKAVKSEEGAIELHQLVSINESTEKCIEIGKKILEWHPHGVKVKFYMYQWYQSINRSDLAEPLVDDDFKSKLENDPASYIHFHIYNANFDLAKSALKKLSKEEKNKSMLSMISHMAGNYYQRNEYENAYEVYQYIFSNFDLTEKQVARLRFKVEPCERKLKVRQSILPPKKWANSNKAAPVFVILIVLTIAGIVYGINTYHSMNQTVWFSNFTGFPARVEFSDGETLEIPTDSVVEAKLGRVNYEFKVSYGKNQEFQDSDSLKLDKGLFFWYGRHPLLQYDIGKAGAFVNQTVIYEVVQSLPTPPQFSIYSGQNWYDLKAKEINYIFMDPPESVEIKSGNTEIKNWWYALNYGVEGNFWTIYENERSPDNRESINFLTNHLRFMENKDSLKMLIDSLRNPIPQPITAEE